MLRDLERTPVLSQDGLVLSKKVQRQIRRLTNKLGPVADAIEDRWKRRLEAIFDEPLAARGGSRTVKQEVINLFYGNGTA